MTNNYTNLNLDCHRPARGGIRRIWASQRQRFGRNWTAESNYGIAHQGVVTGHTGAQNVWFEQLVTGPASLRETLSPTIPRKHDMELQYRIWLPDEASRAEAEQLYHAGDMVFIAEDANGVFWLVGEVSGCRVEYGMATGTQRQDDSVITVTARCEQRYPLRVVATTYLDAYVTRRTDVQCACEYPIADICSVPFTTIRGWDLTCAPTPPVVPLPPFELPLRFNNAWAFDKVNDTAILNNASVGNFGTGDFTYSFWFLTPNNLTNEVIIYKRDSGSPFRGIYFARGSDNRLSFAVGHTTAAGSIHTTAAGLLLANNWYHIVLCKETTSRANWRLYINNVLTGFGGGTGTETHGVNSTNAINFARDPANNVYGLVFIDETTIYNKALTPAEVAHLYNSGNGNTPPSTALANLVARYSFDTADPTGANFILADSSGNGNNGTSSGISVSPLVPHV
jgi:hypothetical protein